MNILRTNLIIHHGVANILGQITKLVHIIGAIQEPRDLASLFQWDEVSESIVQFPVNCTCQANPQPWRVWGYRLRVFLLSSSLTSPSGTGALSDSTSPLTRGINDSIVSRHATIF